MVGTNPRRSNRGRAARTAAMVASTSISTVLLHGLGQRRGVHRRALRRGREDAVGDLLDIGPERGLDRLADGGLGLGAAPRLARAQPPHAVPDLHLAIAAGAGADADGGDPQPPG